MVSVENNYIFFVNREFNDPHPEDYIIRESIGNFTMAIDRSLGVACYKDTILGVSFRHDVYRFLFQNKCELSLADFKSDYFPHWWNQQYERFGRTSYIYRGRTIDFPIRTKCYLRWTRHTGFVKDSDGILQPKQRAFVEIVMFDVVKCSCTMPARTLKVAS